MPAICKISSIHNFQSDIKPLENWILLKSTINKSNTLSINEKTEKRKISTKTL